MHNTEHPAALNGDPLIVGPWTINSAARTLSGPSGLRRLEPKPMTLLVQLATRAGEVVPRQDLLSAAWPMEMATDDVLSRAISEVRRALGDDPRNPAYLQTIRGVGYRLVPPDPNERPFADIATDSVSVATHVAAPQPITGVRTARRRVALLLLVPLLATVVVALALRMKPAARTEAPDAHLLPLSSTPGEESNPRLSPDNSRIAFAWRDSLGATGLFARLRQGGQRIRVAAASARASAWSPDGSSLAVATQDDSGSAIAEVPSLGGPMRLLARLRNAVVLGIDWSPDGRQIAFSSHSAPFDRFAISTVSRDSLQVASLTSGGASTVGDAFPVYASDGRSLAFARFTTETSADIYLIRTDTHEETRLTFDERNIAGLAFTPRGDSIVFASDRDGGSAVWRVSIRGGAVTRIVGSDRRISGLTYARTPGRLVVSTSEVTQQLHEIDTRRGSRSTVLLPTNRADGLPSFSPDDHRVAFVSDRSGSAEVWLASDRGDSVVQLTHSGGFSSVPSWSPDGSRLVAGRRRANANELWLIDVERRTSQRIPVRLRAPFAPSWSRDGRSIIAASNEGGAWQLWRLSLDGQTLAQLTDSGGIRAIESADAKSLIFTKPLVAGLWSRDLSTGVERRLVPSVLAGDWTNWSIAGRDVVFVDRDTTGGQRIVAVDVSTAIERVLVERVQVPMGTGGLVVSNDGRRVLYGDIARRDGHLYELVTP